LDYGHVVPRESHTKRGGIIDDFLGNQDNTKTADRNLQMGHPGQMDPIYRDDR